MRGGKGDRPHSGSQPVSNEQTALMAHLLRRAGFGATRAELEGYLTKGYEATLEELLDPTDSHAMPDDLIRRYHTDLAEGRHIESIATRWMYRLVTTTAPLEEKIALFWSGVLCTGFAKVENIMMVTDYIGMLPKFGLGDFRSLLIEVSKHPAMVYYLETLKTTRVP